MKWIFLRNDKKVLPPLKEILRIKLVYVILLLQNPYGESAFVEGKG